MSTTRELFSSVHNTTTEPLLAGGQFLGDWEILNKPDVAVSAKGDKNCLVHFEFSNDGVEVDAFPVGGYTMTANIHLFRTALITKRYFRIRVENTSGEDMTYLRVYPTYGQYRQPNSPLNGGVQADSDALITRSVLMAQDTLGQYNNVTARNDGSIKVSMANPLTAFGELLVESNTAIIQATAVYGELDRMTSFAFGAGSSVGFADNEFFADSGTSFPSSSTIFTKDAAIYKAGQGLTLSFTAKYSEPAIGSVQWAGAQNGTDAIVLGYKDDQFGLFFRHWGDHEIQHLLFTTGASGATDATLTLNGVAYTIPLTSGTTVQNARELADSLNSQTTVWRAQQVGSRVIIRSVGVNNYAGAFTFSHATAVASFTQVSAGVAVTEEFTPSYDFSSGDILDWLVPQNGNVFKIDFQYLGYGAIDIYAEYPDPKEYVLVHRIAYSNQYTRPSVTNPSFRIGWTAGNRTGVGQVACYGASCAGFTQGKREIVEPARSFSYAKSTNTQIPILVLKAAEVLDGKVNLSPIKLQGVSAATDSTKGAIFKLILNPTLTGNTNYSFYEEDVSCALTDVTSTGITGGRILETIIIGAANSKQLDLRGNNLQLLPNDVLVITAEVTSGSSSQMNASVTWKEDVC